MRHSAQLNIFSKEWYLARGNEGNCSVGTIKDDDLRKKVFRACIEKNNPSATSEDIENKLTMAILQRTCQ